MRMQTALSTFRGWLEKLGYKTYSPLAKRLTWHPSSFLAISPNGLEGNVIVRLTGNKVPVIRVRPLWKKDDVAIVKMLYDTSDTSSISVPYLYWEFESLPLMRRKGFSPEQLLAIGATKRFLKDFPAMKPVRPELTVKSYRGPIVLSRSPYSYSVVRKARY